MTTFRGLTTTTEPAWHDGFFALLPAIYDRVRYAFRGLRREAKQEAIQGSLANAAVAYARLHEQGRADTKSRLYLPTFKRVVGQNWFCPVSK